MKKVSKFIAVALAVMMTLVCSVSAFAAASPTVIDPTKSNVVISGTTGTFNGDYHSASSVVVTYDGKTLTEGVDYVITTNKTSGVNAGTKTLTVTITFKGAYSGTVTKTVPYTINKANNNLSITNNYREWTYDPSTAKSTNVGKSYSSLAGGLQITKNGQYFSINKYGTFTVKPGTPVGTYWVPISVAGNNNYNKSNTVVVKVRVLKASQSINVSKPTINVTQSWVAGASRNVWMGLSRSTGNGPYQYQVGNSGKQYITVSNTGKITIKKGTAKGTYFVAVRAASTSNYSASAYKTVKIRVV